MKIHQTIAALIAVAALDTSAVLAQTGNLFRVSLNLKCRPPQEGGKNRMTARTLIRDCVGDGGSNNQINRDFKLVFNADTDSLQVVNTSDGSAVCDVFQFAGGTNVVGNAQLQRLVFVFAPNSSDSVGSAVIRERASSNNGRVRINGTIQFVRGDLTPDGTNAEPSVASIEETTNVTADVTTVVNGNFVQRVTIAATPNEAQICSGTFTIGNAFIPNDQRQSNRQSNRNSNQLTRQQRRQLALAEAAASADGTLTNAVNGTVTNAVGGTLTNVLGTVTNVLGTVPVIPGSL